MNHASIAKHYLHNAEHLPKSVQDVIAHLIDSGRIKRVTLFGSRARGDHRPNSDVDLAVDWVGSKTPSDIQLLLELKEQPLSLYPIDILSWDEINESFKDQIQKEGRILWEKRD